MKHPIWYKDMSGGYWRNEDSGGSVIERLDGGYFDAMEVAPTVDEEAEMASKEQSSTSDVWLSCNSFQDPALQGSCTLVVLTQDIVAVSELHTTFARDISGELAVQLRQSLMPAGEHEASLGSVVMTCPAGDACTLVWDRQRPAP